MRKPTIADAHEAGLIPSGSSLIKEGDLLVPALIVLSNADQDYVPMRKLIDALTEIVSPVGFNSDMLPDRKDSRFSQLIRNLKSHKTFIKKGFAEESVVNGQSAWKITGKGREWVCEKLGLRD